MEDVRASPFYGELMTADLSPGDDAFLFELPTPDGELVRLASIVPHRPIALVFGSYT